MTNSDLKKELTVIKESLYSLQVITGRGGIEAIDVSTFIDLITDRFVQLEDDLVSTLDHYEVSVTAINEGKESAIKLLDSLKQTRSPEPVSSP